MLVDHLLKIKKEFKNLKKQEIQNIFTEMNQIKLLFNMIQLLQILKMQQKSTAFDKVLRDKAFNIAKNPTYDGYQRNLASMVYIFFDKKTSGRGVNNEIKQNKQLTDELPKPIIKRFLKRRVNSSFKDCSFS